MPQFQWQTWPWYLNYVLLSSVRFLIKVTLLSIYSAIFVSWLVGQSIQAKQMAPNGWHLSISRIWNGFQIYIVWKRHLFLRFLFRTYENIASNRKKGTFFALLRRSLQTEKRYLFRALKFCLVKWEMDEKWTILTS